MSQALFKLGGLRFWTESEIELRELFQRRVVGVVGRTLRSMNPAFSIHRCEGPILHPRSAIGAEYGPEQVFETNDVRGGEVLCLRPETTPSSYLYAKWLAQNGKAKYPLCVWQSGVSCRRETNDGASASKLRFNAFHQLEFQCIYRADTKMDYRERLVREVGREIERFTRADTRVVVSDRLPSYSESTLDIEALHIMGTPDEKASIKRPWREMASCSIRTDYGEGFKVCEIAIGLDRVVVLGEERGEE